MRGWLTAIFLTAWTLLMGACGEVEDSGGSGFEGGYELAGEAEGVSLRSLTLNQGVEVTLIRNGFYLEPEQRNAPLVADRAGRARLELDAHEGSPLEPVLARIRLLNPGQPEHIYERVLEPSPDTPLAVEVWIEAEALQPETELVVELWTVAPASTLDTGRTSDSAGVREPDRTLTTPTVAIEDADELDVDVVTQWRNDSREPLWVHPADLGLRVVLVPFVSAWSGCERMAPAADLRLDARDALMAFNPVAEVHVEVREHPLVVETKPEHLADLFPALQAARDADGVAPNTYYYGLLDACAGSIAGYGGLAFRAAVGPEPEDAWQRVAIGLNWSSNRAYTLKTLVHELGHLQGRHHVACSGRDGTRALDPDPSYPHAEGTIGVAGLNIVTGTDHSAESSHDYMSYCYDSHWVSDWTWAKTFERIEILSAWDHAEPLPDTSRVPTTLLVGMVDEQGGQRWWTRSGQAGDAERLARQATLHHGSTTLLGGREVLAEGEGELLIFALPPELALAPELLEGALLDYSIGGAGGGGSPKQTPISRIM